jgi:hypothetical protein
MFAERGSRGTYLLLLCRRNIVRWVAPRRRDAVTPPPWGAKSHIRISPHPRRGLPNRDLDVNIVRSCYSARYGDGIIPTQRR